MKRISLLISIFFFLSTLVAQYDVDLKMYDFKEIPNLSEKEDARYKNEGVVALYYNRILDYRYENDKIELWECYHITVKVYSSEALADYHKFYLPTIKDEDIIECKGRYIDKDGIVTQLSKNDLVEREEDEKKKKILVFQTVDTNGIFDYFYIVRKTNIIENGTYYIPGFISVKKAEFMVILPEYLKAEFSVYNGLLPVVDTLIESRKKRYAYTYVENSPKITSETVAFPDAHEPRIEFVLAYNYSRNGMRINTINNVKDNLYSNIAMLEKAEISALKKYASNIPVEKNMSELEKIRTIENYLKKEIQYVSINNSQFYDITSILNNKYANTIGLTKIYYYLFNRYKINHTLVLTTNKTLKTFDKHFNGSNFMHEILFYFPNLDMYLSPDYMGLRVGLTPSIMTGQDGLFLETITVGKVTSFLPSFNKIAALPVEMSGDSIDVYLKLNMEKKNISGNLTRILTGYYAVGLQSNFDDMEKEDKDEIIDHYLSLGTESINVDEVNVKNASIEDIFIKPFIMNAVVTDYYLPEFKGNEIIIPVGVFIGRQSEFKQENQRLLPVERKFKSHYYRCIKIEIPQGYDCNDFQYLNIEVFDTEQAENANAMFRSQVRKEGNHIIITCFEYYNQLYYPVESYKSYQSVVNAAAAFNKCKLNFYKK